MVQSAIETEPSWIGTILERSLPADSDPKASYYSYDEDMRLLKALVIGSSSLSAFQVVLGPIARNVADVAVTAVALDTVESVSLSAAVWFGPEPQDDDRTTKVVVQLARELPPFGREISLPISDEDYGTRALSRASARKFADVLRALLGK